MRISKAFAQKILLYLKRSIPKGQAEADELLMLIQNLERIISDDPGASRKS